MFHRSPTDEEYIEHRRMVEQVIESLADSEISMIAKRGVTILSTLLEKEHHELDISQLIHSFCEQEHRESGRRLPGISRRPGWPPTNRAESDNNITPVQAESTPNSGFSRVSTPVDNGSSSYYRHADELFPELPTMPSTSHSWEDVMLLAQNYVL